MDLSVSDRDTPVPTHRVLRRIGAGLGTSNPAAVILEAGTLLRRVELAAYLDGTCGGIFKASVGRYQVLDPGMPDLVVTMTHAYVHGADGPTIEEHPDLEVLPK